MNLEQTLQNLGYDRYEAKLYLSALQLGEGTVSELAHHANIPRTTAAEVLESMQHKGMVSSYSKQTHKYWLAEDPQRLFAGFKRSEEEFQRALPELTKLRGTGTQDKPQVKVYSGVEEMKLILDDVIETKHNILALISWDDWVGFFGEEFIEEFIRRRYQHFLKIRVISPRTESAGRLKKQDTQQMRQMRFLPENIQLMRTTNFIYGDKIAIISLSKKEPTGVVIRDTDIAYANSLYFENLWQHSADT